MDPRDFHREIGRSRAASSLPGVSQVRRRNRDSNRSSGRRHCARKDSSRSEADEDKFAVGETNLTNAFPEGGEKLIEMLR